MVREAWTDERLDDLKHHMDEGFREVRADIRSLQSEVGGIREELGELRAEIDGPGGKKRLTGSSGGLRGEMKAGFEGSEPDASNRIRSDRHVSRCTHGSDRHPTLSKPRCHR